MKVFASVSQIEELAGGLSLGSRQSSMESLASLDSGSSRTALLAGGGPVPCRGSPLHARFRLSAKKALMLWVREQCRKCVCRHPQCSLEVLSRLSARPRPAFR